ncbi:5-methyltetrahydrofolate--homocysteine methyltransferase [Lachnospiraceae bacterium TWA4]|nr:5-methyltetrahydrofolate--homocysteine methyltransferase [Lachnospiraceae bacterium TWA4]
MTREEFLELAKKEIIILDGATGSNLQKMGMPTGVSTELWAYEHPECIKKLQNDFIEAGSQIIYAPTFGCNRISLAVHGLTDRLEELNRECVRLSKRISGGRAYVAGDISTTGKILDLDISYEELVDVYKEQIQLLVDEGVDVLVAETLLSLNDAVAILDAAKSISDIAVLCSITVNANGLSLYGTNVVDAVKTLQEKGAAAVGVNCSVGPDQLENLIKNMKEVAQIPIIAKPNAGLPTFDDKGNAHYDMKAEEFAKSMKKLVDAGAGIVGGLLWNNPQNILPV